LSDESWVNPQDLPLLFCECLPDGTLTIVNPAFSAHFGLTARELIGQNWFDLLAEPYQTSIREACKSLSLQEAEVVLTSENRVEGISHWQELHVRAAFDDLGAPLHLLVLGHDITEHKRVETALRESEEKHRALVEGLPDIIMRFDREGRHIFASNRVEDITGIPAQGFVGKTHRDLGFSGSQCEFWEGAIRQVFASGYPHEETFSFTVAHGEEVIYNWRLIPEFDPTGQVRSVLTISRDISRQKKTEQAYQTLFREMLDGFALHEIICDESGKPVDYRFLSVNPAFERMTGLRGEEIVGKTVLELMPQTENHWIETYGRVALTGEPCHLENYAQELSKHFEVTAYCPYPGQFATIFADVTARKQSEEQVAESHRLLSNLAGLVPGVIYQYRLYPDGHSRFPYASPGINDIYEVSPEEVLEDATPVFGRLHPDDRDRVSQTILESAQTLDPFFSEFRVLLPRQGLRWRWSQARPQRLEDGSTLWHGIILDATQRKETELSLAESEARFKALHNASFGGIAIHDQGLILECNQGLSEMFGYEPSELMGMNGLLLVAEDSREMVMNHIRTGYEKPYEAVGRKKNGETFPMRLEARNVPYRGKNVRTVEFRNLTDIRLAEYEREKLREQLNQAQKMESVGRLAGGVAHDFNNMLGVILGHTELIMDRTDPEQPVYSELQEIRKAAERSANLTRQLLAFARKQTIMPRILDLNDTVEGMLKMLRRLIGEDIDLAWLPGKNLGPVKMDPSQIDQILANLCVNARDAITGPGHIIIETTASRLDEWKNSDAPDVQPGDYVRLSVSDNGCGMDAATIDKLFEPFFTTKAVGRGTGLGLATVYGIVKQNGGTIRVESEPRQGTSFRIYLPALEGYTGEKHREEHSPPPQRGQETILLVEDESAILSMTTQMLQSLGYVVLAAASPEEGQQLAKDAVQRIDLLMTDVVMPRMNGRDLALDLLPRHPGLRCLFMSGYTADVIAHHGVIDEGVSFIQKPFSLRDLGAKIREVLGQT
jgi:PAS domain S-box-containing protein